MKGVIVTQAKSALGFTITTGTIDLVCQAISTGLEYETAAVACGVKLKQARKLMKDALALAEDNPRASEFDEPYKALLTYMVEHIMTAQAQGELALLEYIAGAAKTDWKAADRLLQIMRPDRYSKRAFIYRSPLSEAGSKKAVDMSELSDKELRNIIEGEYQVVSEVKQTDEEINEAND